MFNKAEALFDSYFIIHSLERAMNGLTVSEINLYAYLSCLLALFDGRPIAQWGYHFVGNEWGAPYSHVLMSALEDLNALGDIRKEGKTYVTTNTGQEKWDIFYSLSHFSDRISFLKASTDSALSLPSYTIREALHNEPSIKSANLKHNGAILIDGATTDILYDQFAALKECLGNNRDLLIPATVWMSYLANSVDTRTGGKCAVY